jgi:hypothetical protein
MAPLFTGLKLGLVGGAEVAGPISATGGTVTTAGDGKTIHTFTASGTFTVTSGNGNVEYLVVAGGGGGGGGGGIIFSWFL